MKRLLSVFATCACFSVTACAQVSVPSLDDFKGLGPLDIIEKLGETPLSWQSKNGWVSVTYNGSFVFEGYVMDTRAPGLIMENNPFFYYKDTNIGRLWFGEHLMFFVNLEDDRGFDPDNQGFRSELVEYFVRGTPFDEPWLNLQAGKFATVVGNFVPRHGTFENPLIRDPLPYDFMTVLGNGTPPPNAAALLDRRNIPDRKQRWIPMIWGPVYHTGVEAFGTVKKFNYAFCVANAALSTRPNQWDLDSQNDEHFNYEGHIAYTPMIGLNLGASYAVGPYLKKSRYDDQDQQTFGCDAKYSVGHLELWSEFFATEWQVPNIGDNLWAYSYYVESRYKFTPGFYGSLRWGQIFFNEIEKSNGNDTRWDRDAWRVEVGFGYFIRKNIVTKIQYEHNHQNGNLQQGENMLSMQLALGL